MAQNLQIKGIISYPHLFEPRSVQPGDEPKFGVNCLIAKNDPQVAAILQAIETEKANTFPQGMPPNGKVCLKNMADPAANNPAELHGYYELRLNASADNPPHVVHLPGAKPVTDRSKVYAGAMAWFVVCIKGYNMAVNKGIGGYINGVGLTGEEGPLGRLDNKPTAQQMFANVGAGQPASAPAPSAPPAPVPPAPAAPAHQMTAAANGVTYEAYRDAGWSDEQLIQGGLMLPPGGVPTRF